VLLCVAQMAQRILQYLTEYASQVWSNCFAFGQLVDLVKYANRGTALARFDSLLQTSIVQFTAYIERCGQSLSLRAIGIQSEF